MAHAFISYIHASSVSFSLRTLKYTQCFFTLKMQSHGNAPDDSWLELPAFDLDLQLVKFDPTANAPERDDGTEAPEFCSSVKAPQVCSQLT